MNLEIIESFRSDTREKGHFGTDYLEIIIKDIQDFNEDTRLIKPNKEIYLF